jgi:hypothetical protein
MRHAVLLAPLAAAACGGGETYDPLQATGCPRVAIVADAAEVVEFRPGPGRDLTDVVARGVMGELGGACEYDSEAGTVTVEVQLPIVGERGPAATGDDAAFRYFVAVADPARTILAKEVFDTSVAFEEGQTRAGTVEELEQVIPIPSGAAGAGYQVLIGFQLTPEQLDFNRR